MIHRGAATVPPPEAAREALRSLPSLLASAATQGTLPRWFRGVWLSGSYAVGQESQLSDVDLRADIGLPPGHDHLYLKYHRLTAVSETVARLCPALRDTVHTGLWDEWPLGTPLPREIWVQGYACGILLWARIGVAEEWAQRAGQLPGIGDALQRIRGQRAERVLRYTGEDLAIASVSFAHGTAKALRQPIPELPAELPIALVRVGAVSRRDAEWVVLAYLHLEDRWQRRWPGYAYPERGWDFVRAAYRAEFKLQASV